MSSEVLIYIQNMKKYFTDNISVQTYFGVKGHEEEFFDIVIKLAEKNFEDHGEPQLSYDQLEDIRKKMHKTKDNPKEAIGIFISTGDYGYISLN